MSVTIDTTDEVDRWRWRCPRGHTAWEPTNHHFWCLTCSRSAGVDPEFESLTDQKTMEEKTRDEIEIEGYRAKTN